MKNLQTSQPTRFTAALAIAAGLLTGALMTSAPVDQAPADRQAANLQVDPSIPALTIVARRLSLAEKRQLAHAERLAAGGIVNVGSDVDQPNRGSAALRRF